MFISGSVSVTHMVALPAQDAPSVQRRWQLQFPEVQENVPVKSRRPKPQIPDQGKNAVRKAALSSSLDLELEATERFLARSSLTVHLHNSDRGRNIYKNIPEVDVLWKEERKNVFTSLD